MLAFIKGTLELVTKDFIIVENHGIGYEIRVPATIAYHLPSIGNEVKIHTYTYVREDALHLYGFLSREDLDIFQLLITVNGIGPKGALGILSAITPDDLRFAILSNDAKTISKAPGIGTKTASKLIIELKDKLKLEDAFEAKLEHQGQKDTDHPASIKEEAVQALVALGYSNTDAWKAVHQIEITENMDVEQLLKLSLKKIL